MNLFDLILKRPLFNLLILLTVLIPGHSLGWAIIILTLLIRALLLPSSAHALRQQHKLRKIQPEVKAIQERHKGDQSAQAAAMLELYKRHDIHPLGSCLPMVIQLPILIALYYVFRDGLQSSHLDSLYSFVPRPESVNTWFIGIDLSIPNRILAVLAGAVQFIQTWQLTKSASTHQPESETQRILTNQFLYIMPVMTILISWSLPAALPLYWLITTLFSIGQQWWLLKTLGADIQVTTPVPAPIAPTAEGPTPRTLRSGVEVRVRKRDS